MREHLFKGFHPMTNGPEKIYWKDEWIQGSWIIGSLLKVPFDENQADYYIVEDVDFRDTIYDIHKYACEVIPETVCEFTEIFDKDNRKIWEHDIIRTQPYSDRPYSSKAKEKQHVGFVSYHTRHFRNDKYAQTHDAHWDVTFRDMGKYTYYSWSPFFKCEVIGNIFSNPELLEENNK